jgi:hypothetical protein
MTEKMFWSFVCTSLLICFIDTLSSHGLQIQVQSNLDCGSCLHIVRDTDKETKELELTTRVQTDTANIDDATVL